MNSLQILQQAIQKIYNHYLKEMTNEEVLQKICLVLFNRKLQSLDNLNEIIIEEFSNSEIQSLDEYINYLLYKIDTECELPLELNYKINEKWLQDITLIQNRDDISNNQMNIKQQRTKYQLM